MCDTHGPVGVVEERKSQSRWKGSGLSTSHAALGGSGGISAPTLPLVPDVQKITSSPTPVKHNPPAKAASEIPTPKAPVIEPAVVAAPKAAGIISTPAIGTPPATLTNLDDKALWTQAMTVIVTALQEKIRLSRAQNGVWSKGDEKKWQESTLRSLFILLEAPNPEPWRFSGDMKGATITILKGKLQRLRLCDAQIPTFMGGTRSV
jgi:hypothetical protein